MLQLPSRSPWMKHGAITPPTCDHGNILLSAHGTGIYHHQLLIPVGLTYIARTEDADYSRPSPWLAWFYFGIVQSISESISQSVCKYRDIAGAAHFAPVITCSSRSVLRRGVGT